MHASYVRLFADDAGESHFETVEVPLELQDFAPPAEPLHVAGFLQTARSIWVGGPPGWSGETPHPAPQRQIFCVTQGSFEVTASDGERRSFGPGSVLLLEDTPPLTCLRSGPDYRDLVPPG